MPSSVAGSTRSVQLNIPPAPAPRRQRKPLAVSKHEAGALLRFGSHVFSNEPVASPRTASPGSSAWSSPSGSDASSSLRSSTPRQAPELISPPLQMRPKAVQQGKAPPIRPSTGPPLAAQQLSAGNGAGARRQPLVRVSPPTRALLQQPAQRQMGTGAFVKSDAGSGSSAIENQSVQRQHHHQQPSAAAVGAARAAAAAKAPPPKAPAPYGRGSVEQRMNTVVVAATERPTIKPVQKKLARRTQSFAPTKSSLSAKSPPRSARFAVPAVADFSPSPSYGDETDDESDVAVEASAAAEPIDELDEEGSLSAPTSPDNPLATPLALAAAVPVAPAIAAPAMVSAAVEAAVEAQTAELPPRPPPSLPFACAGIKHGVPWRGSYPRALLISQGSVSTADPETLTPTNTWQAPRDVFKCEVWLKERTGHACTTFEGPDAKVLFLFVAPWPGAPSVFAQKVVLSVGAQTERAVKALAATGVPIVRVR